MDRPRWVENVGDNEMETDWWDKVSRSLQYAEDCQKFSDMLAEFQNVRRVFGRSRCGQTPRWTELKGRPPRELACYCAAWKEREYDKT